MLLTPNQMSTSNLQKIYKKIDSRIAELEVVVVVVVYTTMEYIVQQQLSWMASSKARV